jgi:hypothetical protein
MLLGTPASGDTATICSVTCSICSDSVNATARAYTYAAISRLVPARRFPSRRQTPVSAYGGYNSCARKRGAWRPQGCAGRAKRRSTRRQRRSIASKPITNFAISRASIANRPWRSSGLRPSRPVLKPGNVGGDSLARTSLGATFPCYQGILQRILRNRWVGGHLDRSFARPIRCLRGNSLSWGAGNFSTQCRENVRKSSDPGRPICR